MTSPSLELQAGVLACLRADATVTGIATKVYDSFVSSGAAYPYVNIAAVDETSDDADCIDGYQIVLSIDCWSVKGATEIHQLSDAVRAALRNYEFNLTDNALVYFRHRQTRIFLDADGVTHHAAMDFDAFVEQPS